LGLPGCAVYEAYGVVAKFGELLCLGVEEDDLICFFGDAVSVVGSRESGSEVEMLERWD
jgi:hypothetical protein